MGNAFAGAGYEVAEGYHPCKISFLKIENIHVMRHIMKGIQRDYYSGVQIANVDGEYNIASLYECNDNFPYRTPPFADEIYSSKVSASHFHFG